MYAFTKTNTNAEGKLFKCIPITEIINYRTTNVSQYDIRTINLIALNGQEITILCSKLRSAEHFGQTKRQVPLELTIWLHMLWLYMQIANYERINTRKSHQRTSQNSRNVQSHCNLRTLSQYSMMTKLFTNTSKGINNSFRWNYFTKME